MWAFALALLLYAAPGCRARITETVIVEDSRPGILLSRPFGFGANGWLTFNLSDVKVHTKAKDKLDLSNFGFYLAKNTGDEIAENPAFSVSGKPRCSFLGDRYSTPSLVTFQDPSIADVVNKGGEAHFEASQLELREGVDVVFFANCDEHADVPVSFNIHLEMHNVDRWGHDNFLSVGELELPSLYALMFILFSTGLAMWCYNLRVHRSNAHRIHYLMTLLGALKVLTLAAQCGMYHYLRITGRPDGWNIAYYVFTLFRGVFLFTVIALIGAGWSYMTPFLGDNNKKILMAVIPLQVLAEVAIIILDEFTPAKRTWFAWRSVMHVVDIACCAAILFPIVWRIKHLREAAQSDGKLEQSVRQLVMFKQFYIMVLAYIYFTRVVVFILHATLPYHYVWLSSACEELATLAFYTLTALQFRPHAGQGYFQLLDPEVELSEL